jgi:hypothetical protein
MLEPHLNHQRIMPVRLHLLVDQGQKVARMHRMHSLRPERIRVVSTDEITIGVLAAQCQRC